jgi:hypothetical protein
MLSKKIHALATTALVLHAAGCGRSSGPEAVDPLAALPALDFVETATIGGDTATGPDALGSVVDGTLIPGADLIALVDGTSQEISYFTRTGAHVRTVGGEGGGPGEARALRKIHGAPDGGLCAWDIQLARVTRFDARGAVVGVARTDLGALRNIRPGFVGFLDDCGYVVRDGRGMMFDVPDEPDGLRRDTVRFLLFAFDGSVIDTVATALDAQTWFMKSDNFWGNERPIFGDDLLGFLKGNTLWLGVTDSLRWTRIGLATAARDTVRLPMMVRGVSNDQVAAERRRRLSGPKPYAHVKGTADGRSIAAVLADHERQAILAAPANDAAPAYDRAVPGDDGSIWLREFPMPSETQARWVLVVDGFRPVGQVRLARSANVLAGDREWLLVLTKDAMDAPVVHVLRRSGTAPDFERATGSAETPTPARSRP